MANVITSEELAQAIERRVAGTTRYLVHAEVRPSGKAIVEVDDDKAITLNDLVELNRALREEFAERLDDVELEVGSPGMGRPFRVMRQYQKHTGRVVEVLLNDGRKLSGVLATADALGLQVRLQHPSKVKGRLPKEDKDTTAIAFAEIKQTVATHKFN
jgi:ribosome maturation factor RimP